MTCKERDQFVVYDTLAHSTNPLQDKDLIRLILNIQPTTKSIIAMETERQLDKYITVVPTVASTFGVLQMVIRLTNTGRFL